MSQGSSPTTFSPVQKSWHVGEPESAAVATLRRELGIGEVVAKLLAARGYASPEAASKFLYPSLEDLASPRLLPDFADASRLFLAARESKTRIFIHGDYDVDGLSSTALYTRFLERIGCDVVPHVPHRMTEGYGIHMDAIEKAHQAGAKMFLTCDCGSAAIDQVAAAKEKGMTVVVTDHHQLKHRMPDADAHVNPHREGSKHEFQDLCGAAVAYKLCLGIAQEIDLPTSKFNDHFLELAAMGTLVDIMPLVGENRILAKHGLPKLRASKKPGLQALYRQIWPGEPPDPFTSYTLGFQIGPRLNAVGRMDDAAIGLELLLTKDELRASELAQQIDQFNQIRKQEQEQIQLSAMEQIERYGLLEKPVLFLMNEDWHLGILGLVAGKLAEKYSRPVFVAGYHPESGMAKGSARSSVGFSLVRAIHAHPDLFVDGGGHHAAAGFSIEASRIEEAIERLSEYAMTQLTEDDLRPVMSVDLELEPEAVGLDTLAQLELLEPTGQANPKVTFALRELQVSEVKPTAKPSIVRLRLRSRTGNRVTGVSFRDGEVLAGLPVGSSVDLVATPRRNEYNGMVSVEWEIQDLQVRG